MTKKEIMTLEIEEYARGRLVKVYTGFIEGEGLCFIPFKYVETDEEGNDNIMLSDSEIWHNLDQNVKTDIRKVLERDGYYQNGDKFALKAK